MARIPTIGTAGGIYSYGVTMNDDTVYPLNQRLPDGMVYTFATGRWAVGKEKHYWTFSPVNQDFSLDNQFKAVHATERYTKEDKWCTIPLFLQDSNKQIQAPSSGMMMRYGSISNNKTQGKIGFCTGGGSYQSIVEWGYNVNAKTNYYYENTRALTNWNYNRIAIYPLIRGVYGSKYDPDSRTLANSPAGTSSYRPPWVDRTTRYDLKTFFDDGVKPTHSDDFLGYTIEFEVYEGASYGEQTPTVRFQLADEHNINGKYTENEYDTNNNNNFTITFNDEYAWTVKTALLGGEYATVGKVFSVEWTGAKTIEGIELVKLVPCLCNTYGMVKFCGHIPVLDPDLFDDSEHPLLIKSDIIQIALALGLPVITDQAALRQFNMSNMDIADVADNYEDEVFFPKKKGSRISTEEKVQGGDNIRETSQYEESEDPMGTTPEIDRDNTDTNDYVDEVGLTHPPITPVGVFSRFYALSKNDVDDLCDFLYDNDPSTIQRVLDGLKLNGENPMNFMIGLRMLPFKILDFIDSETEEIGFGNGVATGVYAEKIGTDSFIIELGECGFPTYFGNFLDYEPYTTAKLYIPYCNEVEIPTAIFAGHRIRVHLIVDITTGGCIGCISKVVNGKPMLVMYTTGMIGVEIPMIGTNGTEYVKGALEAASKVVSGALSVASSAGMMGTTSFSDVTTATSSISGAIMDNGKLAPEVAQSGQSASQAYTSRRNVGGVLGGVADIAKGIYDFNTMPTPLQIQGQGSPYTNLYKPQRCYFVIQRPVPMNIEGVMNTMGYACLERNPISTYPDGVFLMAQNPNVQPEHATSNETTELNNLLSSGVWK